MCVCVCVFDIAYSPQPPLHNPGVHSPINWLVGGPRLHVSRLYPIIARGSIHPLYHRGHCVCVCLTLPVPPIPHCIFPMLIAHLFIWWGGHAHMCQDCFQSLYEAKSTQCITGDTVCVCVCMFAIACFPHPPLRTPNVHGPLI